MYNLHVFLHHRVCNIWKEREPSQREDQHLQMLEELEQIVLFR